MDKSQKNTKEIVKKYKCFNITKEELDAILAGEEQIRNCSESSDADYANWANIQLKNIRSFYSKLKIQ